MLKICKEYDFDDLKNNSWSGAIDTLETIEEHGMEDELMDFLEMYFADSETPTDTEVNDLLWFESEWLFEQIGLNEDEEEEDEEEEEENGAE